MAYKTIVEVLYDKWMKRDNGTAFPVTTIETLIRNKFYIWLVKHNWEYYKAWYRTFISKSLFEKAQNVWQGMHYRENTPRLCHLKWFLRDRNGYVLSWYNKKGQVYYKSSYRSETKVNINQKMIFAHFQELLSNFKLDENFKEFNKEIMIEILTSKQPKDSDTIKQIDFKIKKLSTQKESLLELRLEWEIDKEVYTKKSNELVLRLEELENEKNELKNNNMEEKISLMFELIENLSGSYNRANSEWKTVILKNLMFELFINSKKELSYADNSLLKSLFMLQNMKKNVLEVPSGFEPL